MKFAAAALVTGAITFVIGFQCGGNYVKKESIKNLEKQMPSIFETLTYVVESRHNGTMTEEQAIQYLEHAKEIMSLKET